jgi:hypothetical protein
VRKFILLTVIFTFAAAFVSCGNNETDKKTDKTSSGDDAINFARKMYGDNVYLLVRGDMNSNGKPDALAVVINKQLDEMRYWIQRGGVIEKSDDGWKLILRMDERISSVKGIFNEVPETRNGYILSFNMEKNPVRLTAALADAKGKASSEEFVFRWNELDGTYELEKK